LAIVLTVPGLVALVMVVVDTVRADTNWGRSSTVSPATTAAPGSDIAVVPAASDAPAITPAEASGLLLAGQDGGVFALAGATFHGSPAGRGTAVVAIATYGDGYWLLHADGQVDAFGTAPALTTILPLSATAFSAMTPTPTGQGYWTVSANGGVYGYGDAVVVGSAAEQALAAPIVGIAATPTGKGYWLLGADGGIFAYGDAQFLGSVQPPLAAPIVAMAPTATGNGYWLVGADGGIFAYGDAQFLGAMSDVTMNGPVVGMARVG
jgi:hypothetical protein